MRKLRVPLAPKPAKKYKISLPNLGKEIEADPERIPYDRNGLPGSILDIVMHYMPDLIDHACGGVQACSTCHIYVKKGFDECNPVSDREQDYIDKARGPKLSSRLACCCVPNGKCDVEVEVPSWNINSVKEGHS